MHALLLFRRWQRLAFSIKGDSVTLIANCEQTIAKPLARKSVSTISNDGIIAIGHIFGTEASFNVGKHQNINFS